MNLAVKGRILAVDPGEKNIGLALSDETATLARPLMVIRHVSKKIDAASIAAIAQENQAVRIVVGASAGVKGEIIPQTRHAKALAEAIQSQTDCPVQLWDEYGTTHEAQNLLIEMGVPKGKRGGHQDALAASMILQSYLDRNGVAHGA